MELAVAYYRVSTRQQHRSVLGIEAQRATVTRFAETENLPIIAEYVEAETGKGADALDRRPQLAAALAAARKAKGCVLVSKLDRVTNFATEAQPRGIKIDPSGQYLVASGEKSDRLSVYKIDQSTGKLGEPSRYPVGNGANWVEIVDVQ
jgi:DNA-binding beta-propeller fold protein YncE